MGHLLLKRVYGGQLGAWRDRGETDPSFRALALRAKEGALHVSATTLYRSVALVELEARVGPLDGAHITLTHARAVFGLPEPDQARLITAATEERWTVDRLASEAARARSGKAGQRTGRPARPRFVKAIRRLEKLLVPEDGWFDDLDGVERLGTEEAEKLRGTVAAMKAKCEELERRLTR